MDEGISFHRDRCIIYDARVVQNGYMIVLDMTTIEIKSGYAMGGEGDEDEDGGDEEY